MFTINFVYIKKTDNSYFVFWYIMSIMIVQRGRTKMKPAIKATEATNEKASAKPASRKRIKFLSVLAGVLLAAGAVGGGLWAYFNPALNPSVLGEPKIILWSEKQEGEELFFLSELDEYWVDWGDGRIARCERSDVTFKEEIWLYGEKTYSGFQGKIKGDSVRIYCMGQMKRFECPGHKIL